VRHPRGDDLVPLAPLLAELRAVEGLVERSPGVFYRSSRAFLHFHVDASDLYADVRLDGSAFTRLRVTTRAEQRELVRAVRDALA
jgi:hypothetical protein